MTNEPLALKYRPRMFSDITGQKTVRTVLSAMVAQGKVPSAILFSGVRGTGKTTTGRIIAAALNCVSTDIRPCGECIHCKSIFDGTSMDVIEIDAASNGNVAEIRQIRDLVQYSVGGEYRVVLLDEAHSMSREAFNALLKTLEEPPPNTVFILLTTEPGKILETVVSRCMNFEFRRISTADLVSRLEYIAEKESIDVSSELLLMIAERANGGMRDAVMTLDQCTRVGVATVEEFSEMVGESDFGPELIKAMVRGDVLAVFSALDEQLIRNGDAAAISGAMVQTLRDVLILSAGGSVVKSGAALEVRKELAAMLEPERAVQGLRVLWDLKTKVRAGDDARTLLELAAVMVTEALAGKTRSAAAPAAPSAKLSLSQMRSLTP